MWHLASVMPLFVISFETEKYIHIRHFTSQNTLPNGTDTYHIYKWNTLQSYVQKVHCTNQRNRQSNYTHTHPPHTHKPSHKLSLILSQHKYISLYIYLPPYLSLLVPNVYFSPAPAFATIILRTFLSPNSMSFLTQRVTPLFLIHPTPYSQYISSTLSSCCPKLIPSKFILYELWSY